MTRTTFRRSFHAEVIVALALTLLPVLSDAAFGAADRGTDRTDDGLVARIRAAVPVGVPSAVVQDAAAVEVATRWFGDEARVTVRNNGTSTVVLDSVVVFDLAHGLPADTAFYGEGLQMLAQYGGTLASPVDFGEYPDRSHYRLPEPDGFRRVYSMALLEPTAAPQLLLGFTSCRRFVGAFDLSPTKLRCSVDLEGAEIAPGAALELEGLFVREGNDRAELLAELAARLAHAHPRTAWPTPPTGWCSWYCFGPRVTAQDVLSNLAAINRGYRDLEFVQIDDGYQPTMGDWLDTGPGFGGRPVQEILREIRAQGREPAIWVAPFVASPDSKLLREHPSWFVQGDDGAPMPSDRVMFGGWRLGPWYVLDGTNPEVQAHFERLFATMRREWGVRYFKLDAIFWGMMHGGRRSDRAATRVEAYRLGMQAIRRGAGADAYILGCNHPIWPSLGLIDGSRSSLDIERRWQSVSRTGRENLLRAWQNGALWWNDPDAFVQTGLPDNESRFHAVLIHATGGAALSGDDLPQVPAARAGVVRLLSRPTGVAARFADLSLSVGTMPLANGAVRHALFNWSDEPVERTIVLPERSRVRDLLTGEDLGVHDARFTRALERRDAALIESSPEPIAR